jgi:hypothetical protein
MLEPIPYPLQIPSNNGTVFTDSFCTTGSLSRTNQAAITQALGTFAAGLWKINLYIDAEFNWTSGALTVDAFFQLQDTKDLTTMNLWFSPSRVTRSLLDLNERVYLFKNATLFSIGTSLTGVGQTTQLITFVDAKRLL